MLINGEKYACEACVRGHRVSSCSHNDRKLLHVNKKGRPVSQCQHCRSLRKARSQHVKCECNDKAHAKEDCPHIKNENGIGAGDSIIAPVPATIPAESNVCCCGHGARCTCSLKKEHSLNTVHEDLPQVIQPKEPHKSRISSLNNHEGKPTIFSNGHHKPVHKINDAHNHCGAPYRVPSRAQTVHGHREIAQRSTDSLPLPKSAPRHGESPLHGMITSAPLEPRQTKSEHGSPEFGPINPVTDGLINELYIPPLSPTAYSYSPFESQSPIIPPNNNESHLPENIPDSWFTTYDEAHSLGLPANSFSDVPAVDWSTFNFPNNIASLSTTNNGFMSNQTPSYTSYDQLNSMNIPRVGSSGELSEVDETSTVHRPSNLRTVSNASHDRSSPGEDHSDSYRLSSASSFFGTPQANVLAGNLDNLDIDEYVKRTVDQQRRMNSQPMSQTSQLGLSPHSARDSPPKAQSPQHVQLEAGRSPQQYQQSPRNIQQQQQQQKQRPSQQIDSPQSQPPVRTDPGQNYVMPQFSSEHAFTVSEAQKYAHMASPEEMLMQTSDSPLPASIIDDPMWSGTPEGATAFRLDDEREDEDWVR